MEPKINELVELLKAYTVRLPQRALITIVVVLVVSFCFTTVSAQQDAQSMPLTPDSLQRLVAPIALYPDELIAQILAASTYPDEIVEADRWLQSQSNTQAEKLAEEADKQSWDPSVKALTAFPSVLANLDSNLSWTSSLGDAYFNQQQDVLDAIQVLRARAKDAGNLQSTPQQTVTSQGPTIVIEPTDPNICYVPTYNPLLIYGAPIGVYPGYLYDSAIGAPYISFGIGFGIGGGFWRRFGWGFHSWDCNWRDRNVVYNHNIYFSHSPTFFRRFPGGVGGSFRGGPSFPGNNRFNPGGSFPSRDPRLPPGVHDRDPRLPPGVSDRDPTLPPGGFNDGRGFRGFGQSNGNQGLRSGAFSNIGPGGIDQGAASRGRSSVGEGSFGGGRGFGGGGGGFRGGGGHGGGGHH